jgi:hypothetical protein
MNLGQNPQMFIRNREFGKQRFEEIINAFKIFHGSISTYCFMLKTDSKCYKKSLRTKNNVE